MKRFIYLFLIFFSLPFLGSTQPRKEKIEAMKVAFITNRLDLTALEAQQFWPVYNEYNNKLEALRKNRKLEKDEAMDEFAGLTDKELESLVDGEIAHRQKELDIQKEYHSKFKSVLPVRKVAKLYKAEEAFKRELLRRIQNQKSAKNR